MKNDLLSKNIRIKKIVSAASTLSLKDKRDLMDKLVRALMEEETLYSKRFFELAGIDPQI